jgi:hypothetical protein
MTQEQRNRAPVERFWHTVYVLRDDDAAGRFFTEDGLDQDVSAPDPGGRGPAGGAWRHGVLPWERASHLRPRPQATATSIVNWGRSGMHPPTGRRRTCDSARRSELSMLYDQTITQTVKMLENLKGILDKSAAHAAARKFEIGVLFDSRLAPDQFGCMRQIQIACDTAKLGAARLAGKEKEAPEHEDNEQTLEQAKARIDSVVAYLKTYSPKDFVGAEERRISQPRWAGKSLSGKEFAEQHVLPNVYFHIATAYAILRHNGVDVGKKDYLGPLPFREAAAPQPTSQA